MHSKSIKSSASAPLWMVLIAALTALLMAACQPIQPESFAETPESAAAVETPAAAEEAAAAETPAPAEEGEVITLWVEPYRATCTGVAEMQCLQVRRSEDGPVENFYSSIDGFVFVPGYYYVLEVQTYPIDPAPADSSSIGYSLISIESQTPAYDGEPMPIVGTHWRLIAFGNEATVPFNPEAIEVTADFTEDGRVSGSSGCNRYSSTYTLEGDHFIAINDLAMTRMMCAQEQMVVESAFATSFPGHHQYIVNGDKLEMVYAAGLLIFQGSLPE